MQTECPNCHTVFRITQAQLEMADGMVRCGFCKTIFDARNKEESTDEQNQLASNDSQPQQPEVTISNEAAGEAALSAADAEIRARMQAKPYSAAATTAWSLAILVLIAALLTEYIWFNQPELLQHERLTPLTAKLCELMDCTHMERRDPSQIELISRNVYSHPNVQDALMISTTIVNHASYAQPYPEVQIDFSDVRGGLIASRRFKPEEYLQAGKQQISPLPTGTPVTFGLEIKDPGKQAITYEFSFH